MEEQQQRQSDQEKRSTIKWHRMGSRAMVKAMVGAMTLPNHSPDRAGSELYTMKKLGKAMVHAMGPITRE